MEQYTLEVRNLSVSFFTDSGERPAVRDVSLQIPRGSITGIVGESGCGKSTFGRTLLELYPQTDGRTMYYGRTLDELAPEYMKKTIAELPKLREKQRAALRGSEISMVFQEPMTSLNPVVRVGRQVTEALRLHERVSAEEAKKRTVEILESVGIAEAERRCMNYPHELSGGLRQRVMIAMAMICKPKLLIADEPTTALDVTVEAQILKLMRKLSQDGTSILLISHNLGVIAQVCDRVYVMYAGQIVEEADVLDLFDRPAHPYTRGLLASVSSLRRGTEPLETIPGNVPGVNGPMAGCAFAPRCALCEESCRQTAPVLSGISPGHAVRCLRAGKGDEQ